MDETQGRFIRLLRQEADTLDQINTMLTEEADVIKKNDINRLDEITSGKHQLLDQLGILDKQRQLYMDDKKLLNNEQFVSNVNEINSVIQKKLDQCRQLNDVNGSMIEVRQQFNARILNVMHGEETNETTYSANGTSKDKNKNSIARV